MNKQIKELMVQADYPAPELALRAQKLAELIIKECMDVVAKKCASPTAYNALAEHWGIEE
jgi:hypothetical protein